MTQKYKVSFSVYGESPRIISNLILKALEDAQIFVDNIKLEYDNDDRKKGESNN